MFNYYCSSLKNSFEFNDFIENLSKNTKNDLEGYIQIISHKLISSRLDKTNWVIIPILRSGLSMLYSATRLLNYNSVCFLTAKRNKSIKSDVSFKWISNIDSEICSNFYILDPIIASGATIIELCYDLRKRFPLSKIFITALYSSMEGVNAISSKFCDIRINTYAISDDKIDGFLIPKTNGDMGDKLFGDNK